MVNFLWLHGMRGAISMVARSEFLAYIIIPGLHHIEQLCLPIMPSEPAADPLPGCSGRPRSPRLAAVRVAPCTRAVIPSPKLLLRGLDQIVQHRQSLARSTRYTGLS